MAVLGRLLISSAERLDLPDILSMDSYAAGDWKYFLKGLIGTSRPYILKGFDIIDPQSAIGTQGCSIRVAESAVLFPESKAGPFFHGLEEGHALATPIVPELRKNAVNYVYLTLSTFNTSVDTRAFWDPDKDGGNGGEFTQDVNTESVLKVEVNVSTGSFPLNTIPVAKITVGPVVITAIEDARDLMFRLGTGGVSPDPFNRYAFRALPGSPYARQEPSNTMNSAADPNPFQGADKNIQSLKEWMDVVMTKLLELGGTNYWYEDAGTFSLINLFGDALAMTLQSKGDWNHDTATPGLLTWTEDLQIKNVIDKRDIIIRAGSKQLNNEQTMFLRLVRDASINTGDVPVTFLNGFNYVNGVTGAFQNLVKGDWIKKHDDLINRHLRVEEFYAGINLSGGVTTPSLARSIKLNGNYTGTSESKKAVFTKGVYLNSDVQVADRANAALVAAGGDLYWLALRSDIIEAIGDITTTAISGDITEANGTTAKFTAASPHGLIDNDRVTISGDVDYNGTYQVEVEDANTFVIQSPELTLPTGLTATYAIVTTVVRNTADGFQLESANHGFEAGNTIEISDTTGYNGSFVVNPHSATTFSIPVPSALAQETAGLATLARIDVRSESGIERLIRGETKEVAGSVTDAIMTYVGMPSETQTVPLYNVPSSYNAIDGYQNYNSSASDNLTARVSKLTAMMADRVQDRGMKLIGRVTIKNTSNPPTQDITASGLLRLEKPGSLPQTVDLTCSLPTNSAAVMTIDRNGNSAITLTVKALGTPYLLEENGIILFYRLTGTTVYAWDGSQILANGTYTTANPDDSQNKNIFIHNPGPVNLNATSGLITFTNATADISIIVPGSAATNVIDVSAINTLGTLIVAPGSAVWLRINRVASKQFNVVDTTDIADSDVAGALYVTPLSVVPVDQDVVVLFTRIGDTLIQSKVGVAPAANVYEEVLSIVAGAPVDDSEMAGPVIAGQQVHLPLDSRNADAQKEYLIGSGILEVYLNGQLLRLGDDWTEFGSAGTLSEYIVIQQNLEVTDILTFRIDTQGGVFIAEGSSGGGSADSLQTAYNTGRFIATASGQPVVITGPAGQKLLSILGDLEVTGVIDPKGITFIPLSVDPLQPTDHGLWVNNLGELIQKRAGAGSMNITTMLNNIASGATTAAAVQSPLSNGSMSTITKLTPVRIQSDGNIAPIDVSIEAQATAIAGVTAADIGPSTSGNVVATGRIEAITTSFAFGDVVYVSKTGGITNAKPSEGVAGFLAGDYIVKIGVIGKNNTNPANKDLILAIQIIGQI